MAQAKGRLRIMVVEDDPEVREMLELALEANWDVITAADGVEALAALERAEPDLLIVDVMMPRMDGLALVQRIRGDPRHQTTPVVFLTALSTRRDAIEGYKSGADVYLTKPLDLERLERNLEIIIRDRGLTPTPKAHSLEPRPDPPPAPEEPETEHPPHMRALFPGRPRVLVVEDDRDLIDVLNTHLQSEFEIFVAHTGADALERIPAVEPDLITVDLSLPKMSGFQLIELIRAAPGEEKTPIIVITAHASETSLARVRRGGGDELMDKPVDFHRLREAMRALILQPDRPRRWPKTNPTLTFSRSWRP